MFQFTFFLNSDEVGHRNQYFFFKFDCLYITPSSPPNNKKTTYKGYIWEKGHIHTKENIRPAEYLDVVVFLDADWHPMKGPFFSRLLIPFKCHLLKMPIIQNTAFRINTLTAVLLLEDHLHHTKYLAENIWKLIRLNNNSILIKIIIILQIKQYLIIQVFHMIIFLIISISFLGIHVKVLTYKWQNIDNNILGLITSNSCTVIQINKRTNFSCNTCWFCPPQFLKPNIAPYCCFIL